LSVISKTPSNAQVSISSLGNNQYKIYLKGATTSATIGVTYHGSCGSSVSSQVYVRAPQGAPSLPVVEL